MGIEPIPFVLETNILTVKLLPSGVMGLEPTTLGFSGNTLPLSYTAYRNK